MCNFHTVQSNTHLCVLESVCVDLLWLSVTSVCVWSDLIGSSLMWSACTVTTTGCRARSEPGDTRWRTGGEVKRKLANGVGSQYSHAICERGLSSITKADAHTSAARGRLNWSPHRFKWTRPFRGKTKCGFCACAITFLTSYTVISRVSLRAHAHCTVKRNSSICT